MSDLDITFDPYGDSIKSLDSQQFTRLALRFYGEAVATDIVDIEISAFSQANVCASLALLSEIHDLRLATEKFAEG